MIRSRWLIVLVFAAACTALAFGAEAKPAAPAKTAPAPKEEPSSFLGGRDIGLIVNLVDPFTLAEAYDGVQGGLGMKLWLNDRSVVRGLLDLGFVAATDELNFGLSAAYEHHLATGKVSPYVGGIAGVEVDIAAANNLEVFAGGLLGAEVKIIESVAFYVEYSLLAAFDGGDFTLDLGLNNTQVGLIIYL